MADKMIKSFLSKAAASFVVHLHGTYTSTIEESDFDFYQLFYVKNECVKRVDFHCGKKSRLEGYSSGECILRKEYSDGELIKNQHSNRIIRGGILNFVKKARAAG